MCYGMKKMFRVLMSIMFLTISHSCRAQLFVLGADVSWSTEMEHRGRHLYNYNGKECETFHLMKEMGVTAVRLRVWVDPQKHGNWCNKEDVLQKALRAKAQGLDIMIAFHYSDWWADHSAQDIPEAWKKHKYKQMLTDVADYTKDVLNLLKQNGILVNWVQIGNDTSNGMLWSVEKDDATGVPLKDEYGNATITQSMGHIDRNPQQYAGFFKAGYDAAKSVYPESKVIVHIDNGFNSSLYNRNLDILKENGAKWDIIGMSLYPFKSREYEKNARKLFAECVQNIKSLYRKYGTNSMIVETGFEVDENQPWVMESGRTQLAELIKLTRTLTDGHCIGVFYWEPTCSPSEYKLGAFSSDGHPTSIMRAITTCALDETLAISPATRKDIVYDRPRVRLQTTEGDIVLELYNETPKHRDNFLHITHRGILDSTLFHRVIPDFMIQGGDPDSKEAEKTDAEFPAPQLGYSSARDEKGQTYTIPAEIIYPRAFCKRGAVCAARAPDDTNPERRSSSSQFFIAWGRWPAGRKTGSKTPPLPYYDDSRQPGIQALDGDYTVFGEVIQGLDVVEKIQKMRTDKQERPLKDVRILKATIVK